MKAYFDPFPKQKSLRYLESQKYGVTFYQIIQNVLKISIEKYIFSESSLNSLFVHVNIETNKQKIKRLKNNVCVLISSDKSPQLYFFPKKTTPSRAVCLCLKIVTTVFSEISGLRKYLSICDIYLFMKYFSYSS